MMLMRRVFSLLVLATQIPVAFADSATAEVPASTKAEPAQAKSAAPAPPASNKADASFSIMEFQVDGNSLLDNDAIERAVYPFMGDGKSIKDVDGARRALEKTYHDRGFLTVLVNIPPQHVADGVVHLKVVEAPVGKLRVVGSQYHSLDEIKEAVSGLNEGSVPNFNQVQQQLSQVNRSPDRRVTPVLRASETPGMVDVDLQVKDEFPLHASLDLNNHYGPNTDHLRATADVHYDNLFQLEHSVDLSFQLAPGDLSQVRVLSLSYVVPLPESAALALYGVHSDSNVATVGALSVLGRGDDVGARLIKPLPGSDTHFYHSFSGGLDYKDFKQDLVLQGGDKAPTPIHYLPFALQYSATWLQPASTKVAASGLQGETASSGSSTTFSAGLGFTLRGVVADNNEFANKRSGASASYIVLRPSLQRLQALPWDWSLFAKLDGQLASGPLISNEEFSAGGADSVRGFEESEVLGDQGLRASTELRTPKLLGRWVPRLQQSYLLGFGEVAYLQTRDALSGQDASDTIASWGLGYRLKAGGLTLNLDGARTLEQGPSTRSGTNRGIFEVNYGF